MPNEVLLKTDKGELLLQSFPDCTGKMFDAEGCYQYCQNTDYPGLQARKLIRMAKKVGDKKEDKEWYRKKSNFIDRTKSSDSGGNLDASKN